MTDEIIKNPNPRRVRRREPSHAPTAKIPNWVIISYMPLLILSCIGIYHIILESTKSIEQRRMEKIFSIMQGDAFQSMQKKQLEILNSPEMQKIQTEMMGQMMKEQEKVMQTSEWNRVMDEMNNEFGDSK